MRRVVSPTRVKGYAARFPTSKASLLRWLKLVRMSDWRNPAQLKETFSDVDPVTVHSGRTVYVFNIEGNRHRLIAAIHFNTQTVYILHILTHKEYDLAGWKEDL